MRSIGLLTSFITIVGANLVLAMYLVGTFAAFPTAAVPDLWRFGDLTFAKNGSNATACDKVGPHACWMDSVCPKNPRKPPQKWLVIILRTYMGVSKNNGTPKSSILIGFSIINHPFWGPTPIFGYTHIYTPAFHTGSQTHPDPLEGPTGPFPGILRVTLENRFGKSPKR